MSREQYQSHWKDYYQVLGIQPDASLRTIRQAWQKLSQTYHPDVAGNSKANLARIKKLNEAYEVLSDRNRRAKYDQAYRARGREVPEPSSARPVRRRTRQSPPSPTPTPASRRRPQQEEPPPVPLVLGPGDLAQPGVWSVARILSYKARLFSFLTGLTGRIRTGLRTGLTERIKAKVSFARKTYDAYLNRLFSRKPGPSSIRRTRLIAAAGAIGVLALIGAGVAPALLRHSEPTTPTPAAFDSVTPTPLPGPVLTPYPSEVPSGATTPDTTTEPTVMLPPQPTLTPTPTPTPLLRDPIPVTSPEAEALGFWGFQVAGNPWLVDFSSQCQEAPCLRSGSIPGAGISSLWLRPRDLPASVQTLSFDVKSASLACCASFRMVAGPVAGAAMVLPNSTSWTRVETALPSHRPVVFEWQFFSGASGVSPTDGIWIDNIQLK